MRGTTLLFANNLKSSVDVENTPQTKKPKLKKGAKSRVAIMSPQERTEIVQDLVSQYPEARRSFIQVQKAKNQSMFNFDRVMLNAQPSTGQLPDANVNNQAAMNNQLLKIANINNEALKSMQIQTNKTESINHQEIREEISPQKPEEISSAMHIEEEAEEH